MRVETKKALDRLLAANKKVNELHNFGPLEQGKPMRRYSNDDIENIISAHEEHREALVEYYRLFLEEQGKTREEIVEIVNRI